MPIQTLTVPPDAKDAVVIRRAIKRLPRGTSLRVDLGGNNRPWVAGAVIEFGSKAGFDTFVLWNPVPDRSHRQYLNGLATKYGVTLDLSHVTTGSDERTETRSNLSQRAEALAPRFTPAPSPEPVARGTGIGTGVGVFVITYLILTPILSFGGVQGLAGAVIKLIDEFDDSTG